MFGSTFSNGRALTTLKLRKEHLIVDDKLVLGADYIFVLDSLYSVPVDTAIPITLDMRPLDTDSSLMAHNFTDTRGIISTPGLWAVVLHGANLIDCTIVHARITTDPHDKIRQENERKYAESLGLNELEFPYKSEKEALEMMKDRKGYYEQQKARNRITRKTLDWLIFDEPEENANTESSAEFLKQVFSRISEKSYERAESEAEKTLTEPDDDDEIDDLLHDDDDEDEEDLESYDEFLSMINKQG